MVGFGKQSQIGSVLSWKKAQGLKDDQNVIANFHVHGLWGGLQHLQVLKAPFRPEWEKLPHRGPLEGPDCDPVEFSLTFDEGLIIWLNKSSKVYKSLRFICIFICMFRPFFCIFICIFNVVFIIIIRSLLMSLRTLCYLSNLCLISVSASFSFLLPVAYSGKLSSPSQVRMAGHAFSTTPTLVGKAPTNRGT